MQRRVVAVYFVFFLVMGASAYSVVALAEEPAIQVSGNTYQPGDQLTAGGQTYRVTEVKSVEVSSSGHGGGGGGTKMTGSLAWTNESAKFSATLANGSSILPVQASWDGQQARYTTTLANGSSVQYNGTEHEVVVHPTGANFSLVRDGNTSTTLAYNDTLAYQGNLTTVAKVTNDEVTLVWGEPYQVRIENVSNPRSFTVAQQFNVTERLERDPAVENKTVTRDDGNRYVVYRANGSTRPLSAYLPSPDTAQFSEGDTLTYGGNETTVANVSQSGVRLTWTGSQTNTLTVEEGTNVTLGGQEYVATFPSEETVKLSPDVAKYQDEIARQDYFKERQDGLWGVVILSGIAALLLVSLAYMPVRG